jgi:hypothetical protein
VAGTDDGAAFQFGLGDAASRFGSAGVGRIRLAWGIGASTDRLGAFAALTGLPNECRSKQFFFLGIAADGAGGSLRCACFPFGVCDVLT